MKEVSLDTTVEHQQSNVMWNYFAYIPADALAPLKLKNRRIRVAINGTAFRPAALFPSVTSDYFIVLSKALRKELGLVSGQKINLLIQADESKYGMPVPDEFEALLQQDEEGAFYFDKLTPGKQRSLLHLVNKLKSSEKRIEKAIVILEHLKYNAGKLDSKGLQEDFKRASNRLY